MDKQKITFCRHCGDGFSDEEFMFGHCCGVELSTRLETDEEFNARKKAVEAIKRKAKKLGW